jgi:tetratricopeptide (TPR) repeat protein
MVRALGRAPWLLVALLGLGRDAAAQGQSLEAIFQQGNAAYEQGHYQEAADTYRILLRYRIRDARLEYNLGNAEYRLGRLGHAILHYERARRLAPEDPEIAANLELARSMTLDRVEPAERPAWLSAFARLQDRLGPDRQAWIVLGILWIVAGLVAWCSSRPGGWSARHGWLLAVLVAGVLLCTLSWHATYQRVQGKRQAVVLEPAAEILTGPGENNATLATVHEGLLLSILAERQEWMQVGLPNGYNGWIARSAVGEV